MHIEGEFRVRSGAARAYAFFRDPVAFTDCLDDPHEFRTIESDRFEGTVTTGVAFIRGTFRVRGRYTGTTAPTELRVYVQGSGLGSGVDADLVLGFREDGSETTLRWQGEVRLSGPIATLGERMVKATVDKKAAGLFENARRKLETA
ncbi:MAG: SRPBCC domain-containing protein [Thermoplasmata archaeon]